MTAVDANAVYEWVSLQFGNATQAGTARLTSSLGVEYRGSSDRFAPTPDVGFHGFFGEFVLQGRHGHHVVGLGATIGSENGDPYLVFLLDDAETPAFEYHLQGDMIHAVPGGLWMTHIKQMGLGQGGSIDQQRILDTVQRNAPHLRTGGLVDLGALLRDTLNPVSGIAGFLHRTLDFILVRNALRRAHLNGEDDP